METCTSALFAQKHNHCLPFVDSNNNYDNYEDYSAQETEHTEASIPRWQASWLAIFVGPNGWHCSQSSSSLQAQTNTTTHAKVSANRIKMKLLSSSLLALTGKLASWLTDWLFGLSARANQTGRKINRGKEKEQEQEKEKQTQGKKIETSLWREKRRRVAYLGDSLLLPLG